MQTGDESESQALDPVPAAVAPEADGSLPNLATTARMVHVLAKMSIALLTEQSDRDGPTANEHALHGRRPANRPNNSGMLGCR